VSAILKALQKLEADSNRFQNWKINVGTAGGKTRRFKGVFFFGALLALAVLAFAGGFIHIRVPTGPIRSLVPSVFQKVLQPHENAAPPMPQKAPVAASQLPKKIKTSSGTRAAVEKNSLPQKESFTVSATGSRRSGTKPKETRKGPLVQMVKQKPTPERNADLHATRLSVQQAKPLNPLKPVAPKVAIKKETPPLPMFNDPSIILQAIAWAQDPKSRIVVINGQILREGESVDGIIIDGIKEDAVIVRKGIESGRETLVFRNK
jgi:type II secretion system (T2SS) protein B